MALKLKELRANLDRPDPKVGVADEDQDLTDHIPPSMERHVVTQYDAQWLKPMVYWKMHPLGLRT